MIELKAKIREEIGRKVKKIREKGIIPAVLYGPKIKNLSLSVDLKEFEKVFKQAGESSLITLVIAKGKDEAKASSPSDKADNKKFLVLVHAVEIDAISQKPIHIDFYQPRLDEEITVSVPLVFEGEAPAVKDLGGTLVRNIHELEVKALPQNLPHEIKVDISGLKTFEDDILVKDLTVPKEVKILKEPDETVVFAAEPEKVEEELAKPVEEKVEEVEKVEEKKEVEETEAGEEEEK
jgi:large subunit ribosomal protein L25